jgi:hypothetical protein
VCAKNEFEEKISDVGFLLLTSVLLAVLGLRQSGIEARPYLLASLLLIALIFHQLRQAAGHQGFLR